MRTILVIAILIGISTAHPAQEGGNDSEQDDETSRKIIGSSVVTSVSVIQHGEEPAQFSDAVGKPVPRPLVPPQVASPINLLNPDRYEFYTFNDNGDLIKRLMTMKEIQSIVAGGAGEGTMLLHSSPLTDQKMDNNVQDIVSNVQRVLNNEVELNRNATDYHTLDTPDVSQTWSMILPAIFGNTGDTIRPKQKPTTPQPDPALTAATTIQPNHLHKPSYVSGNANQIVDEEKKKPPMAHKADTSNSETDQAKPIEVSTPRSNFGESVQTPLAVAPVQMGQNATGGYRQKTTPVPIVEPSTTLAPNRFKESSTSTPDRYEASSTSTPSRFVTRRRQPTTPVRATSKLPATQAPATAVSTTRKRTTTAAPTTTVSTTQKRTTTTAPTTTIHTSSTLQETDPEIITHTESLTMLITKKLPNATLISTSPEGSSSIAFVTEATVAAVTAASSDATPEKLVTSFSVQTTEAEHDSTTAMSSTYPVTTDSIILTETPTPTPTPKPIIPAIVTETTSITSLETDKIIASSAPATQTITENSKSEPPILTLLPASDESVLTISNVEAPVTLDNIAPAKINENAPVALVGDAVNTESIPEAHSHMAVAKNNGTLLLNAAVKSPDVSKPISIENAEKAVPAVQTIIDTTAAKEPLKIGSKPIQETHTTSQEISAVTEATASHQTQTVHSEIQTTLASTKVTQVTDSAIDDDIVITTNFEDPVTESLTGSPPQPIEELLNVVGSPITSTELTDDSTTTEIQSTQSSDVFDTSFSFNQIIESLKNDLSTEQIDSLLTNDATNNNVDATTTNADDMNLSDVENSFAADQKNRPIQASQSSQEHLSHINQSYVYKSEPMFVDEVEPQIHDIPTTVISLIDDEPTEATAGYQALTMEKLPEPLSSPQQNNHPVMQEVDNYIEENVADSLAVESIQSGQQVPQIMDLGNLTMAEYMEKAATIASILRTDVKSVSTDAALPAVEMANEHPEKFHRLEVMALMTNEDEPSTATEPVVSYETSVVKETSSVSVSSSPNKSVAADKADIQTKPNVVQSPDHDSSTEISVESDVHEEMHMTNLPAIKQSTESSTIVNLAANIWDSIAVFDEEVIKQQFNRKGQPIDDSYESGLNLNEKYGNTLTTQKELEEATVTPISVAIAQESTTTFDQTTVDHLATDEQSLEEEILEELVERLEQVEVDTDDDNSDATPLTTESDYGFVSDNTKDYDTTAGDPVTTENSDNFEIAATDRIDIATEKPQSFTVDAEEFYNVATERISALTGNTVKDVLSPLTEMSGSSKVTQQYEKSPFESLDSEQTTYLLAASHEYTETNSEEYSEYTTEFLDRATSIFEQLNSRNTVKPEILLATDSTTKSVAFNNYSPSTELSADASTLAGINEVTTISLDTDQATTVLPYDTDHSAAFSQTQTTESTDSTTDSKTAYITERIATTDSTLSTSELSNEIEVTTSVSGLSAQNELPLSLNAIVVSDKPDDVQTISANAASPTKLVTIVPQEEHVFVKLGETTVLPIAVNQQLTNSTDRPDIKPMPSLTTKKHATLKIDDHIADPMMEPTNHYRPAQTLEQKILQANAAKPNTGGAIKMPPSFNSFKIKASAASRRPALTVQLDPAPKQALGLEESTLLASEDILEFTKLCNELAFTFWKALTSEGISSARSLVISPFALTSMLAMVFLGARGSTSGEMNELLRLDDMVTFNPHLIFRNITDSVENPKENELANSAFVRELFSDRNKGKILSFFKEKSQQYYSAHVEEVNFNLINDIVRRRTNLLVKRHTFGKISEYLKTNNVWLNAPLAGLSANIFQTDCSKAFVNERDGEMFFQVLPAIRQRRLIPIPAAVWKSGFTAGYDPELDATAVAFGDSSSVVSTVYLMPGQQGHAAPGDSLERLESALMAYAITKSAWSRLLTTLMERPGLEVQLPRFSHRSFVNATNGLQRMGLNKLFDFDNADLRGLTGSTTKDLFISDMVQINTFSTCGEDKITDQHHVEMYPAPPIQHRNINAYDEDELASDYDEMRPLPVDEDRAFYDPLFDEEYLALPLPLRPRQARIPESPRLRFDKPFLFFVRHNPTGMILYMGRFNPRLLP